MKTAGILYHPYKQESQQLAQDIQTWLEARGVTVFVDASSNDDQLNNIVLRQMPTLSLLIVLGGDGSTLWAARHAAPHGVPIFGINLGRVGFLSEAEPDNWPERLAKVLAGEWWLEQRMMLEASLVRNGREVAFSTALNDVVIGRGGQARLVRLRIYVDGDYITTYTADALIVSTPTGSTAYAMAAGGPLLWPRLPNFLVVPVAAHLSLDRAVVLHETAVIAIEVAPEHEAALTADGQAPLAVQGGDQVIVRKHSNECNFVRVGSPSYFYHRLMERFGFWHPLEEK